MTAEEAISYIEHYGWSTTRLGLERTQELLAALGNPQKRLKFIHVAGSNGKGSACAMFDAILRAAGYRTGLYTSPYIQEFCERIRVDGQNIPGEALAAITERVMDLAEKMDDHPSQFELVTAIAMEYFYEQGCDLVVLEVGMGGALDSTNAIDAPELAVITNIGLEHTEYLGDTLEAIAQTKAGIIKPGCSCVCYDGAPEVTAVVKNVCEAQNVPLSCVDFSRLQFLNGSLAGQTFVWKPDGLTAAAEVKNAEPDVIKQETDLAGTYQLSLIGTHQLHNTALVLTGIEQLLLRGWNISQSAVQEGLQTVHWPARLEVLAQEPVVILDGGHNPQCAKALTESLAALLPEQKVIFLAGVLKDKDYDEITALMLPYAKSFVCVTPVSDRALSAAAFAAHIEAKGVPAIAAESIADGLQLALKEADGTTPVVIFGSLYLAGAARTAFHGVYRKWLRKYKIKARDSLTETERKERSEKIAARILDSMEYQKAETILIYEAIRGEVRLTALKEPALADGKKLLYPRCIDDAHMIALLPDGPESFVEGYMGIAEPVIEKSTVVEPEQIDLVVCPCTSFDEDCNRMGMGAGFYDRFLTQCKNADILAVAFETQKAQKIPTDAWDKAMGAVLTETARYDKKTQ